MNHHIELAKEHKKLLKQLEIAKTDMINKRAAWKNSNEDKIRFEFQDAIGLVNKLEKKLWKFQ